MGWRGCWSGNMTRTSSSTRDLLSKIEKHQVSMRLSFRFPSESFSSKSAVIHPFVCCLELRALSSTIRLAKPHSSILLFVYLKQWLLHILDRLMKPLQSLALQPSSDPSRFKLIHQPSNSSCSGPFVRPPFTSSHPGPSIVRSSPLLVQAPLFV